MTILLVMMLASEPSLWDMQDWRTSGEDPCACTDSMPFIIGPRPPVETAAQRDAVIRASADPSCRVSRLAIEALRNAGQDPRPALAALLSDPEPHVRETAVEALKRLSQ